MGDTTLCNFVICYCTGYCHRLRKDYEVDSRIAEDICRLLWNLDDELSGPWRTVFLGRLVIHHEEKACSCILGLAVSD